MSFSEAVMCVVEGSIVVGAMVMVILTVIYLIEEWRE